jgi:alkylhydroperoxidase family enzyme
VTIAAARLSRSEHAPRQHAAMFRLQQSIGLGPRPHDLISLRASQINGCALCLDRYR